MKKVMPVILFLFIGALLTSLNLSAQEKKVIETKGAIYTEIRGGDPNIAVPKPTGDQVTPKPEETASRTDYCKVYIDNWTGYTIDVYIDGEYAGSVAAWETAYGWAIAGKTKLYAKSIGGTVYWGPVYVDCLSEYTWELSY